MSLLLPANERLRKSSVFQRAYTGRKNVNTRLVTLYVVPRAKSERKAPGSSNSTYSTRAERLPFVGFVAAKKVLKSAVARNRVKRRVREAYRLLTRSLREGHSPVAQAASEKKVQNKAICTDTKAEAARPKYKLGQWYVLVFVLHAAALEASWTEILKAVDECLSKAEHKYGVVRGGEPGGKPRE